MPGLEDELGDVVKKARTGLGLSVAELAARSGLSENDLKGVEVYTRHPEEADVRRLADALGLRPDALWELADGAGRRPRCPGRSGSATRSTA